MVTTKLTFSAIAAALVVGAMVVGCTNAPTDGTENATVDGSAYRLDQEPDGARDVIAVRQETRDGEEVVLVGRIGGSVDPWIADRAAFTVVDNSLQACSDIPGDKCKTPWDYCCESTLPTATALVKVVDQDGKMVSIDARKLLGVKELDRVVVHGTATRDDEGNLTVLADGVYVAQ
jgi:hypothetical protein